MRKCIVKGCENDPFMGMQGQSDLCRSCYMMLINGTIIRGKSNYLSKLVGEVNYLYQSRLLDRINMFRHQSVDQRNVMKKGYPISYHIINE